MNNLISQGYFALLLIIALGVLLGRIKIRGISLDVSAVIFVAFILGHFGFIVPKEYSQIGVLFFIFTIGIQAGPGFFESFNKQGIKLVLTTIIIIASGTLVTFILMLAFNIDKNIAVGILTGALTSTPGLAAAIETTQSPLASVGYGIAYPFGVLGVILFVRILPKIFKINIQQELDKFHQEKKSQFPEILNKNFEITNQNIHGKTVGELKIKSMTGATISRVMHGSKTITPTPKTILHLGDLLKAVGTKEALENFKILIGKRVNKSIPLSPGYDVQWVTVTNRKLINSTLGNLNLVSNYNANITRIRRSGIEIEPMPDSQLHLGDRLRIACDKENMDQVIKFLGESKRRINENDFLPVAIGAVLGILIGKIAIPIGSNFTFNLGLTGGVLAMAIILGKLGRTGPIVWTLNVESNQLLRTIGLLFFLAAVGTQGGSMLAENYHQFGLKLFVVGAVITAVPMIVGTLIGFYFFKVNFITLLGTLTGGMTSTPGLAAVDSMIDSTETHIAYATVYPIALVCIIICTKLLAL